jgi:hypothetical protein
MADSQEEMSREYQEKRSMPPEPSHQASELLRYVIGNKLMPSMHYPI